MSDPQRERRSHRRVAILQSLGLLAVAGGCDAGAPGAPAPLRSGQQGLLDGSVSSVDTIDELRATSQPSIGLAVIVLGYWEPGDGGGGLFVWDATSEVVDDDGVVIEPDASTGPGRWRRDVQGHLSVKWFGARGDGINNDRDAIQRAIDYVPPRLGDADDFPEGNTVFFPSGEYVIAGSSTDIGLSLLRNNAVLLGSGGAPNGSKLLFDGCAAGILIETRAAGSWAEDARVSRGAQVRQLALYRMPGGAAVRDAIVIHAPVVVVADCVISEAARWGILIESADSTLAGLVGATHPTMPGGVSLNSNWWRLNNVNLLWCGASLPPEYTNEILCDDQMPLGMSDNGFDHGGGVLVRGSDTNGGCAVALAVQNSRTGIHDSSLGGATWICCYGEFNRVGFRSSASGASLFLGCYSEDCDGHGVEVAGGGATQALAVGGTVAAFGVLPHRVGPGVSRLRFSSEDASDNARYVLQAPGIERAAFDFARVPAGVANPAATWSLAYEPTVVPASYPFLAKSWRLFCKDGAGSVGIVKPGQDQYGGPLGITDHDHVRGGGLPFIAAPVLNTHRRWTHRQAVELAPGLNVVKLQTPPNPAGVEYAMDPANVWTSALTRISVSVELANEAALTTAGEVRVGAHAIYGEGTGRNMSVQVTNGGAGAVPATVVWHYETYVKNGDDNLVW